MDVLLFILFIFLIVLAICAPAVIMLCVLAWVSKILAPRQSRWLRWSAILSVLLFIPQVLNVFIEREAENLVSQSHGEISSDKSTRILAVKNNDFDEKTLIRCNLDCALLLLSGEIEQYLIVHMSSNPGDLTATAFQLKNDRHCSFKHDVMEKRFPARVESLIRELSLTGTCLISNETELESADTLVTIEAIKPTSWLTPNMKGYRQSVSYRNLDSGKWDEHYRDVSVRYGSIFPILLPMLNGKKKGNPVSLLRRTAYLKKGRRTICSKDWLSDREPCFRLLSKRSASTILGIRVSESSLLRSGVISEKSDRTANLINLVGSIIVEDRNPSPNEWALIERYISGEYYESDAFAELVIAVMSNDNFPVPGFYFGIEQFNKDQKALLTSAAVSRIVKDNPGPEIGDFTEKQQWNNLYKIVEKIPAESLDQLFDDLVRAVPKRPYKTQYVSFFEKFGVKSGPPIIDILEADKKRLKTLSPVMCKLGPQLIEIKEPLMNMAERHHIRLDGNYGHLVYLLMDLGVDEERILNTVNPSFSNPTQYRESIERSMDKYKSGKARCRSY